MASDEGRRQGRHDHPGNLGREGSVVPELAVALRTHRVSAFPVLGDGDKVIGIVSEADMLAKEALEGEPGLFDGILRRRDAEKARGVTAAT